MWVKSYSKVYPAVKKEDIWRLWADVNHWPKWDKELEYCQLESSFINGSQFILKPLGGPKIKITLSEVIINQKFTNYCNFFGAIMYVAHELKEIPEGLCITHVIRVTGPLRFIWVNLIAKNVAKSAPKHMDILVDLARK